MQVHSDRMYRQEQQQEQQEQQEQEQQQQQQLKMSSLRARNPKTPTVTNPHQTSTPKNIPSSSPSSRPILSATTAFSVLLLVRLLSAAYATIPDCDEVFNFWEPAHYLSHGYGLQTWEYSPEYAIRSWAYVGLHSIASRLVSFLPNLTKLHEFYALRCLFAVSCAYAEMSLYTAVSTYINRRVGLLYLVFTLCSAGMFHSAAAFLPSTFAMYTTMLGMAAFIGRRTVRGVFWFAVGGLLGWPFSLAMCVPFVVEELVVGAVEGRLAGTLVRFVKGGLVSLTLLATITGIDSAAYRKLEIVPLNIVLYNVFSGASKGPNIYGTEPWWFYLANLSLNFNLLLPFSLTAAPFLILYYLVCRGAVEFSTRMLTVSAPFCLWLCIFTAQPHKEERFMFVAYPALCLAAAVTYHIALTIVGVVSNVVFNRANNTYSTRAKELLNWTALIAPLALTATLGLSRSLAVVTAYSAPLHVYTALPHNATGNLCLAKEWYRFPSSYFLPAGLRARFVKSAFDGLLPGEFPESDDRTRDGTWVVPSGMNDLNIPDPKKYITIDQCDYLVESIFTHDMTSVSEPDLGLDRDEWDPLYCEDFLDAEKTPTLGRALWVPKWVPDIRKWGRYCIFRKRVSEEVGGVGE